MISHDEIRLRAVRRAMSGRGVTRLVGERISLQKDHLRHPGWLARASVFNRAR
jgi:hypothetical protein